MRSGEGDLGGLVGIAEIGFGEGVGEPSVDAAAIVDLQPDCRHGATPSRVRGGRIAEKGLRTFIEHSTKARRAKGFARGCFTDASPQGLPLRLVLAPVLARRD
jgi:hypothetical protein